MGNMPSVNTP